MSTDNRTATQRIEDLEKVVTMLYQTVGQHKGTIEALLPLKNELSVVRDVLKLLNKKTEAMIQAATPGTGITAGSVSDLIVKMNVEELKAQVESFIQSGQLVAAEEVQADSYVVCEESYEDGTLANPRVQFKLDSQDAALTEALKGKKVGDLVSFGKGKFDAKVLEIYSVVEPKAPEATEAPALEESTPTASSEAAPAESDSAAS